MADSLLFDGVDDGITCSIGRAGFTGAFTYVAIAKQTADSAVLKYLLYNGASASGTARLGFYHHTASGLVAVHVGDSIVIAPTCSWRDSGDWVLGAVTKAAGSATPRFHSYGWTADAWTHENGGSAVGDGTTPATSFFLGIGPASAGPWNGSHLIGGVWNVVLSDPEIETLIVGRQAWYDLGSREAWRQDTMSAITSFASGGSSAQTARAGTTLDTGDVPAGWDDTLVLPSVAVTPDYSRFPKHKLRRVAA